MLDRKLNWPHFLVIGGQRCGTTALAELARRHPSIGIPAKKELHFFDDPDFDDALPQEQLLENYHACFDDEARSYECVGEATPIYLYFEHCQDRIRKTLPWVRLIVLLRDPAERAISHYCHQRWLKEEPFGLWRAITMEKQRLRRARGDVTGSSSWRHHSYCDRSRFLRQMQALESRFSRDQILVLWNEDLRDHPNRVMQKVYHFLGVNPMETAPVEERWNAHPEVKPPAGRALICALLRFYFRNEIAALHKRYPRV